MQTLLRDKYGRFASKTPYTNEIKKSVRKQIKNVKTKTTLKNHVIILVDKSGSMSNLSRRVEEKYGDLLREIKRNSEKFNQFTEVSLYQFDYSVREDYTNQNIDNAITRTMHHYAMGGTALLDSLGKVITDGRNHQDYNDQYVSYLVMVLTDGQENSSRIYNNVSLNNLINQVNATDRWSITFQCPPGCSSYIENLGIPSGNIREWEATEAGFRETMQVTNLGIDNYYNSRSLGETKTCGFYVQPDLTNVTRSDLNKLDDLSKQYKITTVFPLGRNQIRDFVQNLGIVYIPGNVYYELVKTELVRYNKQILVRDKTNGKIYGGQQARNLIGLLDGKDHKVIPGNHGKYEIYPQSTSVNRVLKTGTKILIKT